jgi:hypothetical protein
MTKFDPQGGLTRFSSYWTRRFDSITGSWAVEQLFIRPIAKWSRQEFTIAVVGCIVQCILWWDSSNLVQWGQSHKAHSFQQCLLGAIPVGLSTCLSLICVRMQNNLLSGTIPGGLGKLGKLDRLKLANNRV